jgi:hypothetical protein
MAGVKEPTKADFERLEKFLKVRRDIYRSYKQVRDQRYAHSGRADISTIVTQTNTTELARLMTDLRKLHSVLWDWYRNGKSPWPSRLRGSAGKEIQRKTLKFLRSLP